MWNVSQKSLKVKLPQGFSLKEDVDFVYLFYKNKRIAIFNALCLPKIGPKIEEEAVKFLGELKIK